ncbi:MAG: TolC family protein [Acidobacteria bacterium]|nr:MAG: TolC family protein [Acidobacteriota bacterium]
MPAGRPRARSRGVQPRAAGPPPGRPRAPRSRWPAGPTAAGGRLRPGGHDPRRRDPEALRTLAGRNEARRGLPPRDGGERPRRAMNLLALALLFSPQQAAPPTATPPATIGEERPLFGGVASGPATAGILELTLDGAIERGLQRNLALLLAQQRIRAARGARWEALSDLLPHLSLYLSETRQKINLEAFGFTGLPGFNLPPLVGPFNVFDARAQLTETLLSLEALEKTRAEKARIDAARFSYQDLRDLIVLVSGSLYLQAVAEQSRIDAARAQLETARALHELAVDRKKAGLVPSVDVLRAEVERAAREQQTILAETRFAKAKLALARAIGLPLGQQFHLADRVTYSPGPVLSLDDALKTAYESRADWKAAQARLRAAESARRSAADQWLPTLEVRGDYGAIGATVGGARVTYTLGAAVRVSVFDGGKRIGKVLQADAALESERMALEDLRGRVRYEVEAAALDVKAAQDRVGVAERAVALAKEELTQAQDRFRAGVANNIDVVEAQEALASATETYISSLYDHNVAKAAMARALGVAEATYKQLLRGE